MVYLLNIADAKHLDYAGIDRLVLVDTRQPSRIGNFASILDKKDLEIHIYDHHPPMEDDIKGDLVVQELIGATVTLLVGILKEKGIRLVFVMISDDVRAELDRFGITDLVGEDAFYGTGRELMNAYHQRKQQ